MGAYLQLVTPGIPLLGALLYPGSTSRGALPLDLHGGVHQHDADRRLPRRGPAGGHLRASSGSWTSWRRSSAIDPIELRRRNCIRHDEFPYTTFAGLTYDSGNYEAATEKALELFGYDELRRRAGRAPGARRRRPARHRRVDLHRDVRAGAIAVLAAAELRRRAAGSTATVRMLPTGKVEVVTGTSPHGQGHETSWRADRRRRARRAGRRRRRASTATPRSRRSAWTPTGRARWPSAASPVQQAAEKVHRQGARDRRAPARGRRR